MKKTLSSRRFVLMGIFIAVGVIYIIRLLFLQVFDDSYAQLANRNALRFVTQYPARGLIYDRKGELLVYNELVYDLMVIPRQVKDLDTNLLCKLVGIDKEQFLSRMQKAYKYSSYAPSSFEKQISKEDFGPIQEKLYLFHGFFAQSRTLRYYPHSVACHVLGYVGEVNENNIKKNPYYKKGDYIGMSGMEKYYEDILRGKKGSKITLVDVHNREKGSFQNGEYDTAAVAGENLYCSIDLELQKYAESLMQNKRGSIVAIEPKTGEILCFVSAPFYDPNLLVGRVRGNNYMDLLNNIAKPLFNRALMAEYPPGSIFKVAQAMIALDMGVISPNTSFACDKSLVGCHQHPSASNVKEAIKMSCNPYFYRVYQRIIQQENPITKKIDSKYGLAYWDEEMKKMGFGTRLGIDLPDVKKGFIPDTGYYNRYYKGGGWNFYTIYSNSIGQGEVGVIPLQMANLAAIVANRGWYIIPHLVKYFGDENKKKRNTKYSNKHLTLIPKEYWDIAVEGMYEVVHQAGGTARKAKIDDIAVCGKTGTAQNYGNDHSVFICFAPKDDPQIALSVYVENAQGGGGSWAAPIASLVVEKYINKEVKRKDFEKMYMEVNPCQPLPLKRYIPKSKKK
ncbi:MAG: penicillin-binding protein 2 [Bacteroidales bacterium]|jgi:penicillin-binding protein 2|nr:penicillin-binding protein 2 [Bacteroidales bacterium]